LFRRAAGSRGIRFRFLLKIIITRRPKNENESLIFREIRTFFAQLLGTGRPLTIINTHARTYRGRFLPYIYYYYYYYYFYARLMGVFDEPLFPAIVPEIHLSSL